MGDFSRKTLISYTPREKLYPIKSKLVQLVQLVQLRPTLTLVRALFQPHMSRMRQDLSVSATTPLLFKKLLYL